MVETSEAIDINAMAREVAQLPDNGRRTMRMTRISLAHGRQVEAAVRRRAWAMIRQRSVAPVVFTPAARATDAESSHEAAAAITASGQREANQQIVASAVRNHPGCTSRELTQHCELDRVELGRRMSECETAGTIKRGAIRRCRLGCRRAVTWWPA